jgi:hypothetical protein
MVLSRRLQSWLLLASQKGGIDDRLLVDAKCFRNDIPCLQVNAQQSGILKQIAAGVAVALGVLIDELLNARAALVITISFLSLVITTFSLRAVSSAFLRSGFMEGTFLGRPFG